MAEPTHRQLVEEALTLLSDGLAPWVSERMVASVGNDWLLKVTDGRASHNVSVTDPQFLLKLVDDRWQEIFGKHLSNTERSYVKLLKEVRNEWAHDPSRQFSADEVYRTLDQASVVLEAVAAPQAEDLNRLKRALQRRREDRQVRDQAHMFAPDDQATAVSGLPPWREVIVPHADVREGRLKKAEFAADLWDVYQGTSASEEYADPVQFFRRTHPTEGLRFLLTWALQRTADRGGQPVIDLQTNFGGGKTHSLLALYHLFGGADPSEVQWLADLVVAAGVGEVPRARRAVLVGNKIQAGVPSEKPDGTVVRTLWGELAYQVGGPEGYSIVQGADETATNPGGALSELLRMCAPCVILIDEWVAYARQLYDREGLPGGSFETQFTFAQTLTEVASSVPGVCLVVSLPESTERDNDRETGGPAGREALERIRHVVGRISTPWRPASKEEAYEIVRRRLFEPLLDPDLLKQRDAQVRAFAEYYKKQRADFPQGVSETAYTERLRAAYPIHPDLFDRLYEDWSTLPRFQRTRGVLRLMATVVESLWRSNDQAPLIMAGGIPLTDPSVRDELQQMLEDRWDAVITEEVDGDESRPARIEHRKLRLGQRRVCRRLTRAIFISSVPWWRADPGRAARDDRSLRLSVALPGEQPALFTDALADLSKELRNLYTDRAGYYFSLQTNLTARAEDLARDMSDHAVEDAIAERLKEELRGDRGPLTGGAHPWPPVPGDVPDEREVRLVVLGLASPHGKSEPSPAAEAARTILLNARSGSRKYRNAVLFLAPGEREVDALRVTARSFLAWKTLEGDAGRLELTSQQQETVATRLSQESEVLSIRLREAYRHLLAPRQADPQDLNAITFDVLSLSGAGSVVQRAVRKIDESHVVLRRLGGTVLALALRQHSPRWKDPHIRIADLVEDLAQYPYLDLRVSAVQVLLDAIADGTASTAWATETFAYADTWDKSKGRYVGLVRGAHAGAVSITGLIVRPDAALAQQDESAVAGEDEAGEVPDELGGDAGGGVSAPVRPRRFHGSIPLDPDRPVDAVAKLAREILAHAPPDADVQLTLDIEIRSNEGFSQSEEITIRENARALKFDQEGFEEE